MPSKENFLASLSYFASIFLIIAFPAFSEPHALPVDSAISSITINSSNGLQILPIEPKNWYQIGIWPIITATLPNALTSLIAILIVYIQASRSFRSIVKQKKIDLLSTSLNEFYNPLLALIDINAELFAKAGPRSFPEHHIEKAAAALVWEEAKLKILENNKQVEFILRNKSHLMNEKDALDNYKGLLIHISMYEIFQKIKTDAYKKFLFPQEIRSHIASKRSLSLDSYNRLVKEKK